MLYRRCVLTTPACACREVAQHNFPDACGNICFRRQDLPWDRDFLHGSFCKPWAGTSYRCTAEHEPLQSSALSVSCIFLTVQPPPWVTGVYPHVQCHRNGLQSNPALIMLPLEAFHLPTVRPRPCCDQETVMHTQRS